MTLSLQNSHRMAKLNTGIADLLSLGLLYVKKFTSFCQVLKRMHTKENWFPFFCTMVYMGRGINRQIQYKIQVKDVDTDRIHIGAEFAQYFSHAVRKMCTAKQPTNNSNK